MLNLRKRVVTSLLLIPGMNLIHLMGKMHILSLNFEFQFNSDEWKTTISVPTGENPLLSYEINWLVSGYLSLLKNWYHVRCIRHLRKKSCDYISYDLKTLAMLWNISSGKSLLYYIMNFRFFWECHARISEQNLISVLTSWFFLINWINHDRIPSNISIIWKVV